MSATLARPSILLAWPSIDERRYESIVVSRPDHDFDRFFVDNYERLVRSLTAVTGDRELACDAVQDAFVKASARWRRISRYEDPVGWVRRVAINRSRDLHRSDQRRRRREQRAAADADQAQPDRTADLAGALHVSELFRALPDQQRRSASLFYVEQLSVAEIAAVLGLSPGAVKFHLNRARATLRDIVEGDQREETVQGGREPSGPVRGGMMSGGEQAHG